jgi:hypothetical protein
MPRDRQKEITVMLQKMKRYEYPIKVSKDTIKGSYTIKADAKPLGFPHERLVQEFEMNYLEEREFKG